MGSRDGGVGTSLLLLSGLLEDEGDDGVGGTLHHADDGVVDGILKGQRQDLTRWRW